MQISTNPPSGFRDFSPEDCARREAASAAISRVYRSFGFERISTPAAESLEVLLGKGGPENERLIFKILKRGESLEAAKAAGSELADSGLRFDLTVPLARYYSRFGPTLANPFKAFQIGPVWRAERSQRGRFREFFQCDADILGAEGLEAELDVIKAILAAFKALSLDGVSVKINDRRLLHALLERAGVPEPSRAQACILLDKLDKTPPEQVRSELAALTGEAAAEALMKAAQSPEAIGSELKAALPDVFDRLQTISSLIGPAAEFCPTLVRGFDYYTSTVFEFRHPKFAGSIGGGGRYDHLTQAFGGKPVPACGGSIGFERLMLVLAESEVAPASGPRYCLTIFSEELRAAILALADTLREARADVDVYPGSGPLKKQFKYADQKKARYAVVLGPDENAAGQVRIKDLKSGEERLMGQSDLIKQL